MLDKKGASSESGDTLDPPVSVIVDVSRLGLPEPEFRDRLRLPDFSSHIGPGSGESFPRSRSMLAWPVFMPFSRDPGGPCRSPEVYRISRVLLVTLTQDPEDIAGVRRHGSQEYCVPVFTHRDLGWFRAPTAFNLGGGCCVPSDDSGFRCRSTSTLLAPPPPLLPRVVRAERA